MKKFRIFIDSANIDDINSAYSLGMVSGITTNPSLLLKAAKEKGINNFKEYINRIFEVANHTPVSLEVLATDYEGMVNEAKKLNDLFGDKGEVFIKIPINPNINGKTSIEGYKAIKELSKDGIQINATLVFTPGQAYWAAKAGSKIISPFVGRINEKIRREYNLKGEKNDYFPMNGVYVDTQIANIDGIVSGIDLVKQCVKATSDFDVIVLAASIRHPQEVYEAKSVGAHAATIPPSTIYKMLENDLTKAGMESFLEASKGLEGYADLLK